MIPAKRAILPARSVKITVATTRFVPSRSAVLKPDCIYDLGGVVIRNTGLRNVYIEVV